MTRRILSSKCGILIETIDRMCHQYVRKGPLMPSLKTGLDNVSWRVSRRCDGGQCIMVGCQDKAIIVGITTQPSGPYVIYPVLAWERFLFSVKRGDFDRLG